MNETNLFNKPVQVVKNLIQAGEGKVKLPFQKMFWLGILAGIFIACGASASNVAVHEIKSIGLAKLAAGVVFPVGFIMVVLIGGELFTGDCMMMMGAMKKKFSYLSMLRVLIVVLVLNLLGGVLIAYLVYRSGQLNYTDGLLGAYTVKVAYAKVNIPFVTAFVSGILCNIFVCFAVLTAGSAKDVSGKLWASFFPIMAFVVSGYEHSVANMYYIPAGIFAMGNEKFVEKAFTEYGLTVEQLASLNWGSFFVNNELPVVLGNFVGGAIFVGALMYMIYKKDVDTV